MHTTTSSSSFKYFLSLASQTPRLYFFLTESELATLAQMMVKLLSRREVWGPLLVSVFVVGSIVRVGEAEVYECGGVWTDRPCGELGKKLQPSPVQSSSERGESPPPSRPYRPIDTRSVRRLFDEVDLLRLRAFRQHGISISLTSARAICEDASESLGACRKALEEKEREINELIIKERAFTASGSRSEENLSVIQQSNAEVFVITPRSPIAVTPQPPALPPPSPRPPLHGGLIPRREDKPTAQRGREERRESSTSRLSGVN